jgi:hypothetical protein
MADLKNQFEDKNKQIEILKKKLGKENLFKQFEATAEKLRKLLKNFRS